jgi:hypothetical protein
MSLDLLSSAAAGMDAQRAALDVELVTSPPQRRQAETVTTPG